MFIPKTNLQELLIFFTIPPIPLRQLELSLLPLNMRRWRHGVVHGRRPWSWAVICRHHHRLGVVVTNGMRRHGDAVHTAYVALAFLFT